MKASCLPLPEEQILLSNPLLSVSIQKQLVPGLKRMVEKLEREVGERELILPPDILSN